MNVDKWDRLLVILNSNEFRTPTSWCEYLDKGLTHELLSSVDKLVDLGSFVFTFYVSTYSDPVLSIR